MSNAEYRKSFGDKLASQAYATDALGPTQAELPALVYRTSEQRDMLSQLVTRLDAFRDRLVTSPPQNQSGAQSIGTVRAAPQPGLLGALEDHLNGIGDLLGYLDNTMSRLEKLA